MKKEQKSLIKKALEFLSLSIDESQSIVLAKHVTVDGQEIEVSDEDGSTTAADGEYQLENGSVLVVAEGVATVQEAKQEEEVLADEPVAEDTPVDTDSAIEWLQKAIDLHTNHMNGSAPTDEASQKEMMNQLGKAMSFLQGNATDEMKMSSALEAKIAELEAELVTSKSTEADLTTKNTELAAVKLSLEAKVTELQNTPAVESVNLSTKQAKPLSKAELHLQRFLDENGIK